MKKHIIIITAILLASIGGNAQDIGLSTMSNLWQTNTINPAKLSDRKFILSLPGISGSYATDGITFNDITRTNENGELVVNANQLVDALGIENNLGATFQAETFSLVVGGNKWQAGISHAIKSDHHAMLPQTLAQFGLQGNQQFIGQTVDIAPEFNSQTYSEWSLSLALTLDRLTIGIRPKLLGGIANLSSSDGMASVHTADDGVYTMTLESDYQIQSAGILSIDGLEGTEGDVEVDLTDIAAGDLINGKNSGFGLDLGATFQLTDNILISGSILDIGSINWTENASVYTSQGEHVYKGLDFINVLEDDDVDFSEVGDTLAEIFQFEKNSTSYRTNLTMRTYWTIDYQMTERLRVGALIHSRHINSQLLPTFGVNANLDLGRWWTLGTVISQGKSTGFNVGANTAVRLGPVQLFASTDNMLGMLNPLGTSSGHVRFGMNLAFGKRSFEMEE